jgi:biotin transporter BioY
MNSARVHLRQQVARPPGNKPSVLGACIVCAILLSLLTFLALPLPDGSAWLGNTALSWQSLPELMYVPQVPVALFLAALLGPTYGFGAVVLFLAMGALGLPVFSGGGGIGYFSEPVGGYLLGMLLAGFLISRHAARRLTARLDAWQWFATSIQLAGTGVLMVHAIGTVGLLFQWVAGGLDASLLLAWWERCTLAPILYDYVLAACLLIGLRMTRMALWVVLY